MKKRSILIGGHKTSVSLEDEFWGELKAMAARDGRSVTSLIGEIDAGRLTANLSSALRLAVLSDLKKQRTLE